MPALETEGDIDLRSQAVDMQLMQVPVLYGLASVLSKVEHWVFDRDKLGHSSEREREMRLIQAANILSDVSHRLSASSEVIELLVSLSSRRRFALLLMLDHAKPSLTNELLHFAREHQDEQGACAHFVHWLEVVQRAQQIQQIFSAENVSSVCAVLAQSRNRPVPN